MVLLGCFTSDNAYISPVNSSQREGVQWLLEDGMSNNSNVSPEVLQQMLDAQESKIAHLLWDANIGLGNRFQKRFDNLTIQLRYIEDKIGTIGKTNVPLEAGMMFSQNRSPEKPGYIPKKHTA
jgi:hypothetical protein